MKSKLNSWHQASYKDRIKAKREGVEVSRKHNEPLMLQKISMLLYKLISASEHRGNIFYLSYELIASDISKLLNSTWGSESVRKHLRKYKKMGLLETKQKIGKKLEFIIHDLEGLKQARIEIEKQIQLTKPALKREAGDRVGLWITKKPERQVPDQREAGSRPERYNPDSYLKSSLKPILQSFTDGSVADGREEEERPTDKLWSAAKTASVKTFEWQLHKVKAREIYRRMAEYPNVIKNPIGLAVKLAKDIFNEDRIADQGMEEETDYNPKLPVKEYIFAGGRFDRLLFETMGR